MNFFLIFLVGFSFCEKVIDPILFVGPLGGQGLECKLDKAVEPHFWCRQNEDWFRLWMNIVEEVPYLTLDCFMNNIEPHFDAETKTFSNAKGVSIRPADFGGMGAFEYLSTTPFMKEKTGYMHNWMVFLEKYGYETGKSLRGFSYDWRFGPKELEKNEKIGFPAVQKMIEEMYSQNGNRKVHVMGHSLGAPMGGYFLSSFPTQEWKDKYIASFISLGGPFDGSFMSPFLNVIGFQFYQLFKPNLKWLEILKSVGGTQWMTPQLYRMDEPFFFTKAKPEGYSMNDYKELMKDVNSTVSYEIYEWEKTSLKNKPPGVTTHCIYGTELPTAMKFYVEDPLDTLNNKNYSITSYETGDSTVHDESLRVCDGFANLQPQPVVVQRYPGMSHSPMVMNQTLWEYVLKITTKDVEEKKVTRIPTIELKY